MMSPLVQLCVICLIMTIFTRSIQGLPTASSSDLDINSLLQNLTYNEYYYQPTVALLYQVDLQNLQQYIDPQFTVVSPYNNNSAYIVVLVGNQTAYFNGVNCYHCIVFTYLQTITIYTIVQYNNTLNRETLAVAFNFTPPVIASNLYQSLPYGSSMMNPGLVFSANNDTGDYQFSTSSYINLGCQPLVNASLNIALNYNSNQLADVTDQGTLAGFYLSAQNNINGVQSSYRKCYNGTVPSTGVRTGQLSNYLYTTVVNCTNVNVASNYIRSTIGNIAGLDEAQPAAAYYIPYTYYNSVSATPNQSNK